MMESLYLLLPLSIVFVLLIGGAFWWAIFSGQFDDLQKAGNAVLVDDDTTPPETAVGESVRTDTGMTSSGKV